MSARGTCGEEGGALRVGSRTVRYGFIERGRERDARSRLRVERWDREGDTVALGPVRSRRRVVSRTLSVLRLTPGRGQFCCELLYKAVHIESVYCTLLLFKVRRLQYLDLVSNLLWRRAFDRNG